MHCGHVNGGIPRSQAIDIPQLLVIKMSLVTRKVSKGNLRMLENRSFQELFH